MVVGDLAGTLTDGVQGEDGRERLGNEVLKAAHMATWIM